MLPVHQIVELQGVACNGQALAAGGGGRLGGIDGDGLWERVEDDFVPPVQAVEGERAALVVVRIPVEAVVLALQHLVAFREVDLLAIAQHIHR